MKKLFYEVEKDFRPVHYVVMGYRDGEFLPMTFDAVSGRFCQSFTSGDPKYTDEVAEAYDKEAAMQLMKHHAVNNNGAEELNLFPIYVQQPPQLYMIFGRHADNEDDMPTPLCQGSTSPLTWSRVFDVSDLPTPEIFDLETAQELVRRQEDFQRSLPEDDCMTVVFDMYIVPLNVKTSSKHSSPYLNPASPVSLDSENIIEAANYSRSLNPDEEDDAWHMPASLGGAEIVPAKLNEPISSLVNPAQ